MFLAFLFFAGTALSATQPAVYGIDTIAGSAWVGDNGPATAAILVQAEGIAFDSLGNLYVADAGNHRVRKITRAGTITTFAGTGSAGFSGDGGLAGAAQLNSPYGLMFDGAGDLLIADLGNARVRLVTPGGNIATVAGGGSLPAGGVNEGSGATAVALNAPRNLASDGSGGFYISDFGANCVFRVALGGSLTTAAGTGIRGYSGDGSAANRAQLAYPAGIVIDRNASLYIADSGNHVIRKVTNGTISTLLHASTPTGLTIDSFSTLYVADPGAGEIVALPLTGSATAYNLSANDLAFGTDGYLYATSDTLVWRVSFTGPSLVVAGGGNLAYGDGGAATNALLNDPSGIAADSSGNVYIADRNNNRIRHVAPDGAISTIAGTGASGNTGDSGFAVQATFNAPSAVTLDPFGNLYVVDGGNQRVRYITPAGLIYGLNVEGLVSPAYAIGDSYGNVFVSDAGNGTILKVAPNGAVTTLLSGVESPAGLALDSSGDLYFVEAAGKHIRQLSPSGMVTSFAEGTWIAPRGITLGSAGDFFVADAGLNAIVHVDSAGNAAIIAGTGAAGFSGDAGPALEAQLSSPWDICTGAAGALDVADLGNNRVRQLVMQPATIVPPTITVVNAASLQSGPIAAGMLIELLGTGLGASDAPNTQVLFGLVAAPIRVLNRSQFLVEAPAQIGSSLSVAIQVMNSGNLVGEVSATVAQAAPALFASSGGQASAVNQDGTLNSASNPAALGSIMVLYGTGEGVTGLPVTVTVGGYPAQVLYSGPVAGYAGLWQINIVLPSGYIAPGTMNVIASVGPLSTQAGLTIAVY
jgi:uncharacterized protein (TIGR03437 family)